MTTSHSISAGVAAVVLGGGGRDDLAQRAGVAAKALVPLRGKPMGAYVLEAIRGSQIEHLSYVGETRGLEPYLNGATSVPAGLSLNDSFALGLGAALTSKPERVLLLSADIPWISSRTIDTLLQAAPPEADLLYPVITRAAAEAQFPTQKRTYVRMKEGQFTGGNVVLLTPKAIAPLLQFVDKLYRGRKNPLAIASMFGLDILVKIALGTASVGEAEDRGSSILGVRALAHISEDASLGADIDDLDHAEAFSL